MLSQRFSLPRLPGCTTLLWCLAAAPAWAVEPPQSAGCRAALQELQVQETAASAVLRGGLVDGPLHGARLAQGKAPAAVQNARRRATQLCLGGPDDVAAPQRVLQPPVTVAPVTAAPAMLPPAITPRLPATAPPLLPSTVAPPRPSSVTSCDANGCWANDGSRLNRIGPNLIGPRGICTTQGSLLHCP